MRLCNCRLQVIDILLQLALHLLQVLVVVDQATRQVGALIQNRVYIVHCIIKSGRNDIKIRFSGRELIAS
jgi:hypothetical protein